MSDELQKINEKEFEKIIGHTPNEEERALLYRELEVRLRELSSLELSEEETNKALAEL